MLPAAPVASLVVSRSGGEGLQEARHRRIGQGDHDCREMSKTSGKRMLTGAFWARSSTVRRLRARNAETGTTVCEECELADSLWPRFRGLMGRAALEPGHGLLLCPAGSI